MTFVAWLLGAAAALYTGLTFVAARLALHPRPLEPWVRSPPSLPTDHGSLYEPFSVEVEQGVTLRGWWIPARTERARGTVVGLIGVASPKTDWSPFPALIGPRGHDLVLVDMRGHGESDEDEVTWGYREPDDVIRVLDHLAEQGRPVGRVVLVGTSMGAVTAIRVAVRDTRVIGLVAQSAYSSIRAAFTQLSKRYLGPLAPTFRWGVFTWVRLLARTPDFVDVSTLDDARRLRVPTLVAQGTADAVVHQVHAHDVFDAVGSEDKEFALVEGGGHVSLWKRDHPEYREQLLAFLDRVTATDAGEESSLSNAPDA